MNETSRSRRFLTAAALLAGAVPIAFALSRTAAQPARQDPAPGAAVPNAAALALLVGIDECRPSGRDGDFGPLAGAENDVRRAAAMLRERFGFVDEQIVALTGADATHENIVRAFHDHLVARAEPGTRVVFWFSGHGSRVPDRARADRSPRAAHEEPFDETFVAYDSRWTDPDGGHDIADDELFSLLAAVRSRDVLVVTDCCHSGGVLRGGARAAGVREARSGSTPVDRERIAGFWPRGVPLRDDPHGDLDHVVQIAACDALEEAGEVAAGGEAYGTLTWVLCEVLREVEPAATWGEVALRTRARVAGIGTRPAQRVQLIGDGDRAVFGGTGRAVPKGYVVDRDGARSFRIGAGSLHGIGEGTVFDLVDLAGQRVGRARADTVRVGNCAAHWAADGAVPDVALRAVEAEVGAVQPRLRVAFDGVPREWIDGCAFARAAPPDEADYTLRAEQGRLVLRERSGRDVRHCAHDAGALREELQREHRFRTLWQGVAAPGRYRLDLRFEAVDEGEATAYGIPAARLGDVRSGGGASRVVGADVLRARSGGSLVRLHVTNSSDEDLHVAVISATEAREVKVLYGKSSDNFVRAGATVSKVVWLGPNEGWPEDVPMVDRYIAIATPRFADFTPFESDASPASTRGDLGPMPPFLREALGGTRTRGDMELPFWGIATCDLQVLTPEAFERALGR